MHVGLPVKDNLQLSPRGQLGLHALRRSTNTLLEGQHHSLATHSAQPHSVCHPVKVKIKKKGSFNLL